MTRSRAFCDCGSADRYTSMRAASWSLSKVVAPTLPTPLTRASARVRPWVSARVSSAPPLALMYTVVGSDTPAGSARDISAEVFAAGVSSGPADWP
ncbi:hypothetical protein SMD44_08666 [Streptomyces alboflavus]|uniref:Uncharacterized protein n=1 Tax=Streptomyces alboflavus TaxID=67267 RepID=A0A1Z1WS11_9ACTN|nr:hypothetical protein SMD44_08666 [Streptomyces alboflavus]